MPKADASSVVDRSVNGGHDGITIVNEKTPALRINVPLPVATGFDACRRQKCDAVRCGNSETVWVGFGQAGSVKGAVTSKSSKPGVDQLLDRRRRLFVSKWHASLLSSLFEVVALVPMT